MSHEKKKNALKFFNSLILEKDKYTQRTKFLKKTHSNSLIP